MTTCESAKETNTLQTKLVTIDFESPDAIPGTTSACPWTATNQLVQEKHTAYVEQHSIFDMPSNAKICDIRFEANEQPMKYDDHFVFSFDDRVLASNSKGLVNYLADAPELKMGDTNLANKMFDWTKIYNQPWTDKGVKQTNFYCLGQNEGSVCSWPATDTTGIINIDFAPSLLLQIAHQYPAENNTHRFSFVTTGDNDPSKDCRHTPLTFQAKVYYISQ
jgi:hypothetical protein